MHLPVLEPEADTGGGGEGGLIEEAVGESVLHAGPEGAEVAVEALGEFIIGQQRDRGLGAAAAAAAVVGAAGVDAGGEAVLLVAVVGGRQIQLRGGGKLHSRPEHLQGLLSVESGIVGDSEPAAPSVDGG